MAGRSSLANKQQRNKCSSLSNYQLTEIKFKELKSALKAYTQQICNQYYIT